MSGLLGQRAIVIGAGIGGLSIAGARKSLRTGRSFGTRVRLIDKARHNLRKPVVPPGLLEITVHPLLNDSPMTLVGNDKAVEIQLEPILHGGTVDLGD